MRDPQVRKLLLQLPTDGDFDGFCLDYFPETRRLFSGGMDRSDHPYVAASLRNLGWLLIRQNKREAGEALLERALSIEEKISKP